MVKTKKLFLYKCLDCNEYFVARIQRHQMFYCPNAMFPKESILYCNNAVDLEEEYSRIIGNVKFIRELRIKEENEIKNTRES